MIRNLVFLVLHLFALVALTGCDARLGSWIYRWHGEVGHDRPRVLAGASITPITNTSGGASGISFSGDSYDVACTASAATGTMYPAMHDGTAWTIYYQYPCAFDGAVVTKISCVFPAKRGSGYTWNAFKTGSASLSSCTAEQRYNGVPLSLPQTSSSGGGGGTALPQATINTTFPASLFSTGAFYYAEGGYAYASSENLSWKVYAPTGSQWTLRFAGAGAAAPSQTLEANVYESSTLSNVTWTGVSGGTIQITPADGSSPNKTTSFTKSGDGWLIVGCTYSDFIAYPHQSHVELMRTS